MSQKTITVVTCDQCPEPGRAVLDTYRFSLGTDDYETELCAEHKVSFDLIMSPYLESARRVTGRALKRNRNSEPAQFRRDAREWGRANGRPVSARGRISESVLTEYRAYLAAPGHENSPAGRVA